MSARNTPVIGLVPFEKYNDLIPYFEAFQQLIQEQGAAITSAASATALDPPAGGTGATAGAYDNAANRDLMITSLTAVIADIADIRIQFNLLLAELRTEGTIDT